MKSPVRLGFFDMGSDHGIFQALQSRLKFLGQRQPQASHETTTDDTASREPGTSCGVTLTDTRTCT